MAWRKKYEGLDLNCTEKGSYFCFGSKVEHFLVAIAFNCGVILCEQCHGNINGEMFAQFILDHFNDIFKKSTNPKQKFFYKIDTQLKTGRRTRLQLTALLHRYFRFHRAVPT